MKKPAISNIIRLSGLTIALLIIPASTATAQDFLKTEQKRSAELIDQAVTLAYEGKFSQSLKLYIAADLIYPKDAVVVHSIARCYEMLSNCSMARTYFIKALHHPAPLPEEAQAKARDFLRNSLDCLTPVDADTEKKTEESQKLIFDGIKYYLAGDLEAASESFQESTHVYPTVEGYLRHAQIGYIQNDLCGETKNALGDARKLDISDEFLHFVEPIEQDLETAECSIENKDPLVDKQISDPDPIKTTPENPDDPPIALR